MSQEAMSGIDFEVAGVVSTEDAAYTILVDEASSMYLPVACDQARVCLVNAAMTDKLPFDITNFGLYFTFASLLKADGVGITEAAIIVGKNKGLTCYMDMVQNNELGMKVSRIPVIPSDAMVLCAMLGVPVVVYGVVGTDFAFSINKNIPKENIFSFICDDLSRSEKLMAMRQGRG